jgi:hypothetical protein
VLSGCRGAGRAPGGWDKRRDAAPGDGSWRRFLAAERPGGGAARD